MHQYKFTQNKLILTLVFAVFGFVVYAPVIGNVFLSDDYDSLYRIYIQKRIIYREFLRPMIDISFYINYLISGLSPWSYYLFNITVHIVNSLLIFRFASGYILFAKKDQNLFALLSSFLFLIYPFHNESIAWLSGRLSSMACFFALICLIITNEKTGKMAMFISAICFLLGLLCYESIIFLPLMILIIQWLKEKSVKKISIRSGFWAIVTGIYLTTRFLLSGEIAGDYGGRLSDNFLSEKILNIGKVFGRLFFPGSENQRMLILETGMVGIFLIVITIFILKVKHRSKEERSKWIALIFITVINLIIPIGFGVSTRTSESDRLLYFPSCFICILITYCVLWVSRKKVVRLVCLSIVSIYFLCFLELNNRQWIKASNAAESILKTIRNKNAQNIILMNVPDELDGAFVFRNGLKKALIINKLDTSQVRIMNYLKREEYLKAGRIIQASLVDSTQTIFPYWKIIESASPYLLITDSRNNSSLSIRKDRNLIYYWNKEALIKLF